MKALVYLLGARALDIAQERDDTRSPVTEDLPGPLATTDATAARWRRWRDQAGPAEAWSERPRPRLRPAFADRPALG
jgi:hypothetical protein